LQRGHYASWKFLSALGELRGVFGIYVAKIAVAYGIAVEKELSSIIPEKDEKTPKTDTKTRRGMART